MRVKRPLALALVLVAGLAPALARLLALALALALAPVFLWPAGRGWPGSAPRPARS